MPQFMRNFARFSTGPKRSWPPPISDFLGASPIVPKTAYDFFWVPKNSGCLLSTRKPPNIKKCGWKDLHQASTPNTNPSPADLRRTPHELTVCAGQSRLCPSGCSLTQHPRAGVAFLPRHRSGCRQTVTFASLQSTGSTETPKRATLAKLYTRAYRLVSNFGAMTMSENGSEFLGKPATKASRL